MTAAVAAAADEGASSDISSDISIVVGADADEAVGTAAGGLNSRIVNVNLETVLEFDSKDSSDDNTRDVQFINNIQQFPGKVDGVVSNFLHFF